MKKLVGIALAAATAFLSPACTNKEAESEAPVFITVDIQLQPGFVNVGVTPPVPVQINTIVLTSHFKDPTASDPQGFSTTQCQSYTVHFQRTDGGTVVPPDQQFGCGVLIPAGGSSTLTNFPILPASAVQGSPFDQLLPFNGGIDRETGKTEIQMSFTMTFYGHTVSGFRVQSETATGILLFQDSGVTPLSRKTKVR